MPFILVRANFRDFATWKAAFDEVAALRRSYGSKGVAVYRNADRSNEVVILGEYEDLEKARQLFQSPEFREATQRGGVTSPPEVTFLDEVDRLPA